jgi:hypothetical protein
VREHMATVIWTVRTASMLIGSRRAGQVILRPRSTESADERALAVVAME